MVLLQIYLKKTYNSRVLRESFEKEVRFQYLTLYSIHQGVKSKNDKKISRN